MTKITFHRDRFGVHIYYAKMNTEAQHAYRNQTVYINNNEEFKLSTTMVVPEITRVTLRTQETQVVGFLHVDGMQTMSVANYQNERARLKKVQQDAESEKDMEAEVRAEVAYRRFCDEWKEDKQNVDLNVDVEFEIVDIEYPADDRLFPMRHFKQEKINYFEVDGDYVARKFMHAICQAEGLREAEDGRKRRTYYVPEPGTGYYGNDVSQWRIENGQFNDNIKKANIRKNFEGSLSECREYINGIEAAIRADFDEWKVAHRSPTKLTVSYVLQKIDHIERQLRQIDSKVRTQRAKESVISYLHQLRLEVKSFGLQDLMESEDDFEKELEELDNLPF